MVREVLVCLVFETLTVDGVDHAFPSRIVWEVEPAADVIDVDAEIVEVES